MRCALPTPSQTVGPFFNIGMPGQDAPELVAPDAPGAIEIVGIVVDGEGNPISDALIEVWQANRAGRYAHPEDLGLADGFRGFGRTETDADGGFRFVTFKPGPVPHPLGPLQAPHLEVSVFARGLLKRLATRMYFPDEEAGQRRRSRPVVGRAGAAGDAGRARGGRRPALGRPPPGRRRDGLLRRVAFRRRAEEYRRMQRLSE